MEENSRWKTLAYAIGGLAGLAAGLAAAFMFIRARENSDGEYKLTSGQGVKIGLGVVGFLRQLAENFSK